jgi:hypothetical protein
MQEYQIRQGFGPRRVKEYFVVETDGDTWSGVVAGPFESELQSHQAIEGLRPLYSRRLAVVGGHLTGWRMDSDRL